MAVCKLCNMDGLEWSETIDPKTGKSFLFNSNNGTKHVCTERVFCKHPQCIKVFQSYDIGWRHMLQNEYHHIKLWSPVDEKSKESAISWGVPRRAVGIWLGRRHKHLLMSLQMRQRILSFYRKREEYCDDVTCKFCRKVINLGTYYVSNGSGPAHYYHSECANRLWKIRNRWSWG